MFFHKARKLKALALGLCLMAALPVQAITQEEMVYNQVSKYIQGSEAAAIAQDICDASYTYDVDPILVAAVFTTESHFNNAARSGVGAVGISQLMPATAASLNINPYNRRENIFGGVKYLSQMVNRYRTRDNPFLYATAAYNAGPGAVDRAGGVPNYQETQNYVRKVEQTRQKIWRMAGREAVAVQPYRNNRNSSIKVKEAPIFPSLKAFHEQRVREAAATKATHNKTTGHTARTLPRHLSRTAEIIQKSQMNNNDSPFENSSRIAKTRNLEEEGNR